MNKILQKNFVFAGNRAYVYEQMLELGLNIKKIFAVKNSYFQKYLESKNIEFDIIDDKKIFIQQLKTLDFDYFISNGLPIILPISELKKRNDKKFINIHPSFLPDLKGADPVPGALLFGKDSGATCHYMNDSIDSGDIISQVKIKNSPDLDAGLLYQLSFLAEKEAFKAAYESEFKIVSSQIEIGNEIYYTFKEDDLKINFNGPVENIISKIKAFSNISKGAYFELKDEKFKVFDADYIHNEYFNSLKDRFRDLEIIFLYENCLVFKKHNKLIKFKQIQGDMSKIIRGMSLNEMG